MWIDFIIFVYQAGLRRLKSSPRKGNGGSFHCCFCCRCFYVSNFVFPHLSIHAQIIIIFVSLLLLCFRQGIKYFSCFFSVNYVKPEYKNKLTSIEMPQLPELILPDFSSIELPLTNFSFPEMTLPEIKLPNISMPDLSYFNNMSMPEIPSINLTMPELPESYYKYKSATAEMLHNIFAYIKSIILYLSDEVYKMISGVFAQNTLVSA